MTTEMIILQNGRIVDPATGKDGIGDVWIEDGVVIASRPEMPERALCLDLSGKWVTPGLIDMHVHLREPGREEDETIATGTVAQPASNTAIMLNAIAEGKLNMIDKLGMLSFGYCHQLSIVAWTELSASCKVSSESLFTCVASKSAASTVRIGKSLVLSSAIKPAAAPAITNKVSRSFINNSSSARSMLFSALCVLFCMVLSLRLSCLHLRLHIAFCLEILSTSIHC